MTILLPVPLLTAATLDLITDGKHLFHSYISYFSCIHIWIEIRGYCSSPLRSLREINKIYRVRSSDVVKQKPLSILRNTEFLRADLSLSLHVLIIQLCMYKIIDDFTKTIQFSLYFKCYDFNRIIRVCG